MLFSRYQPTFGRDLFTLPYSTIHMQTEASVGELPTEMQGLTFQWTLMLHSPQLGPQNSLCYILCLQFSTLSTKGRAVLAICLLLTLLFLAKFYFREESFNAYFLHGLEVEPVRREIHFIFLETLEAEPVAGEKHIIFLETLEAEPVPGAKHIIFLETQCVLSDSVTDKQSGLSITQCQACAVASAANTNPDSKVYLLYTC